MAIDYSTKGAIFRLNGDERAPEVVLVLTKQRPDWVDKTGKRHTGRKPGWSLPGGCQHPEDNGFLLETINRETGEETGLILPPGTFSDKRRLPCAPFQSQFNKDDVVETYLYWGFWSEGIVEGPIKDTKEIERMEIFPLDKFPVGGKNPPFIFKKYIMYIQNLLRHLEEIEEGSADWEKWRTVFEKMCC